MTDRTAIERALDGFLADGPERVGDQAIARALDAVDRTRQQRGLFAPWRSSLMAMNSRLAMVMIVAIVAVGGAFYLLGSNAEVGSSGPTPTPTIAPTPIVTAPIALYSCGSRTVSWDGSSAIDLTGTWAGDDEGVYYLREIGDEVWWLGMSGVGGPVVSRGSNWTNVYHGTLSGDTVTGTYADVPGGQIQDNGPVIMKLTPTSGGGISLVRQDPLLSTGFGGTKFTPCTLG